MTCRKYLFGSVARIMGTVVESPFRHIIWLEF